ncbi:hypothetical protein [Pseudoneobacillus sp. C159]
MMDRDLIAQVVAEVIKRLTSSEEIAGVKEAKPNLLVFGNVKRLSIPLTETISARWNMIGGQSLDDIERFSPEKVLFLDASQDLLVKGAIGLTDTPESEALARSIWANIPVTLIPTDFLSKYLFADPGASSNREYLLQIKGYVEQLQKLGVSVETLEAAFQSVSQLQEASQASEKATGKKLLTQRDVQAYKGKQILVDENTIITPLARDTARELGKTIELRK